MEYLKNALAGNPNEVVDSTKVPTPPSIDESTKPPTPNQDDGSSAELPPQNQDDDSSTELPKSLEEELTQRVEDAQKEDYGTSSSATSETKVVPSQYSPSVKTTRKRKRSSPASLSPLSNHSSPSPAKNDATKKIKKLETALKKLTQKVAHIERSMPKCFTTRRRKIRKTTAIKQESISI